VSFPVEIPIADEQGCVTEIRTVTALHAVPPWAVTDSQAPEHAGLYVVTHLPTGWTARGDTVPRSLPDAIALCDALAAQPEWWELSGREPFAWRDGERERFRSLYYAACSAAGVRP
jgi:hypothetical protein